MKNNINNVLANDKKEKEKEVYDLVVLEFEDSFLFDSERLMLEHYDDVFKRRITAVDIYNEFEKIDKALNKYPYYSTNIMLVIMERLIENRYKKPPKKTIKKYLKSFENDLVKLFEKLEIGFYPKGFSDDEKKQVSKSIAETVIYLRSIGKWKLADDVLIHYKEPLDKPIGQRKLIAKQIEIHTEKMNKECKITKKEAKKLLTESTNKIKTTFANLQK